jgi:zinc/manganese transport system substrate-binding protein
MTYTQSLTTSRKRSATFAALALLSVLGLLVSCGSDSKDTTSTSTVPDPNRPLVIATTPILGDLVRQVGGDEINVEVLIPLGADPHDFEPSAAQAAQLRDASLIVANGLGLEERLESALDGAEKDGVPVFDVGDQLDPLVLSTADEAKPSEEDDHDHGHDHDAEKEPAQEEAHNHGAEDPHVWLDPERMATAASLVATQLATTTGLDASPFQERAATYADAARAAETEARALLAELPADQRKLITNHDALEYFAQRFNLEVIGTVIPGGSTLAEPSAADLSDLVALIEANNVKAIFSESTVSSKMIESLAREVGSQVSVVELSTDTLGEPGSPTATYPGLIVTTARLIANGLSGR